MLRVVSLAAGPLWRQPAASLSTGRADRLREGDCARVTRLITKDDVRKYGELVGDHNPVHEEIVHGTFLLGLVSGVMASKVPGPGTVLTSLTAKFVSPCHYPITVEVLVQVGRVRRITTAHFTLLDKDSQKVFVTGEASCYLSKEQLQ